MEVYSLRIFLTLISPGTTVGMAVGIGISVAILCVFAVCCFYCKYTSKKVNVKSIVPMVEEKPLVQHSISMIPSALTPKSIETDHSERPANSIYSKSISGTILSKSIFASSPVEKPLYHTISADTRPFSPIGNMAPQPLERRRSTILTPDLRSKTLTKTTRDSVRPKTTATISLSTTCIDSPVSTDRTFSSVPSSPTTVSSSSDEE
jgi:hypothetical protein